MLRLFLSLFRRCPERAIYRYHDGSRTRHADPLDLWLRMADAAGEDWPELLRTLTASPPPAPEGVDVSELVAKLKKSQHEAADKLADAACHAFRVDPLSDHTGRVAGLTRGERVALCSNLLAYFGRVAGAARPFSRSPGPAAPSRPG